MSHMVLVVSREQKNIVLIDTNEWRLLEQMLQSALHCLNCTTESKRHGRKLEQTEKSGDCSFAYAL